MKPSCSFPAFMATLGFGLLISATPAHAGPGTALSFNGTNNYVNATIPALGSNYTICAWVSLRSGGDFNSTLLGVLTGTACNNSVEFLIRGNTSATDPQYLELGRCGSFSGQPSAYPVPLRTGSVPLIDNCDPTGPSSAVMARKLRVQYPGALYHVMNRGDRREPIFKSDADNELFLQTLGEACAKTGWQVHAVCLMGNHFHAIGDFARRVHQRIRR